MKLLEHLQWSVYAREMTGNKQYFVLSQQRLIHMSSIWFYVISCVCLSGKPSHMTENFNIGYYTHTVRPHLFIPVMLMGTIDFYCFTQISVSLVLIRGYKVSELESNTYLFPFLSHFPTDQDEI